jgi:hypothetical protein
MRNFNFLEDNPSPRVLMYIVVPSGIVIFDKFHQFLTFYADISFILMGFELVHILFHLEVYLASLQVYVYFFIFVAG